MKYLTLSILFILLGLVHHAQDNRSNFSRQEVTEDLAFLKQSLAQSHYNHVPKGYMIRPNGSEKLEGVIPDIFVRDHLLDETDEPLHKLLNKINKNQ